MTTAKFVTTADNEAAPVPVRSIGGDVVSYYESILEAVPDAGGDGVENILEQLAGAESVEDLDQPWRAGGLGKYQDVELVITAIRKLPSDFGSGLAYFLVVDGAVRDTGEKMAATTGSLSVVAQLLKAWQLGVLPVTVIPRLAKRATKEGFFPMHLEFPKP